MSSDREYYPGADIILEARFESDADDIGTVTCYTEDPDGVEASLPTVEPEPRLFRATLHPTKAGIWRYRFESDGAPSAARERSLHVRRSFRDSLN